MISLQNLRELFEDDVPEEEIFKAVVEWIHHDQESRLSNLEMLMSNIQVSRLPKDIIEETVEPFLMVNEMIKVFLASVTLRMRTSWRTADGRLEDWSENVRGVRGVVAGGS